MRGVFVGSLLGLLAFAAGGVQARPQLERVSFAQRSDGRGYVVRLHLDGAVSAFREPRVRPDGAVEVVLFNATAPASLRRDRAVGPVADYRVEPADGHVYLTLYLDASTPVRAAAYRDAASHDLLVGLTYTDEAPSLPAASARTPAPRVPVRNAGLREPAGPAREAEADPASSRTPGDVAATRGGTADVPDRERWRLDTIVIDPGHGGKDPGGVGNGVTDKEVALAVGLELGRRIEEELGVRVVYTRRDDRFVPLRERGRIANQAGGKLFISIHANVAPGGPSAHGAETLILGLHKSETAREVMERENSVVQLENNPDQYKELTEEALIRLTLAQSAYMRQSEELAEKVQNQLSGIGRKNRGVKQAGLIVLWGASMPAILVEVGFLTNKREAAFLSSRGGQKKLADAIFEAVREYKAQYEKGLHLVVSE